MITANETAMGGCQTQAPRSLGKAPGVADHYGEWLEYAYLQRGRTEDPRARFSSSAGASRSRSRLFDKTGRRKKVTKYMAESFTRMRMIFSSICHLWGDARRSGVFDLADRSIHQHDIRFSLPEQASNSTDAHAQDEVDDSRIRVRRKFVI